MDKNKDSQAMTKECWNTIIDYEKSYMKANPGVGIPVKKLLFYFGIETICALYGCIVADEEIARRLICKEFEEKEEL